jgi:hypothetical protein
VQVQVRVVAVLAPVVVVRKQVRVVAVLAPVVVVRKQVRVVAVLAPVAAARKQVRAVAVLAPVPRWVLAQVQLLWVQAGLPLVLRKLVVALLSRAVALAQPDAGCVLAQDVLVQQYDAPARLE